MNIYTITSDKPLPYVYKGTHLITGEFYIGSRTAKNIQCSHLDLQKYRTSSREIKKRFDEFNWVIIAEFFTGNDAYDFEQESIYQEWNSPLLLNKSCYYGKLRFRISGPRSKEHSGKISKSLKGRPKSEAERIRFGQLQRGRKASPELRAKLAAIHTGMKHSEESKQKMRKPKANPFSEEHKAKIRDARAKQVIPKQNIVTCPHCGKQGGDRTMQRWHFDRCKF